MISPTKSCICGHLASEHAPGSGACMALRHVDAPPALMSVCACNAYVPPAPEPIGRWALRMAGMALEIGLAGVGLARAAARDWWASWRRRSGDP